ncbi:hypothetical protein OK349_09895 [Sphingomonas sp. BT-65]|uniref:hypothetical protein n=1 Tax=Sphingomonas sp. BT-65 TaxID=2989821 RepID=UPI002235CE48|nr:hypothetical protein [Sphingomonas sp. BT-65]MCW4462018.1 hypothetical protein [Sphingomonas sp. BT-65]
MKTVPLVAAAGSIIAYATLAPQQGTGPGRIAIDQRAGKSSSQIAMETPTPTAGFDINAPLCSLEGAEVRELALVNTAGDDSITNAGIINAAIVAANADLATNPNDSIALKLPAGNWEIGKADAANVNEALGLYNVNYDDTPGIEAERPGTGRLIIAGAGMTDATGTTLTFTNFKQRSFEGARVYRFTLCDMHLTRSTETVSQGTVVGFLPQGVWSESNYPYGDETLTTIGTLADGANGQMAQIMVLDLHGGFPELNEIYDEGAGAAFQCSGRYIRKYQYYGTKPVIELDDNGFMPWLQKWKITGTGTSLDGMWAIGLGRPGHLFNPNSPNPAARYKAGDQIAIKSKKTRDAIWIGQGRDIVVENVRMTRASRIALRGGDVAGESMDDVRITNIGVERMPAKWDPVDQVWRVPMISTAEGGPQVAGAFRPAPTPSPTPTPTPTPTPCSTGSPPPIETADPMTNAIIENADFYGTGDDAIGAFNVSGLLVRSVRIEDSFGRGIALADGTTTPCIRALIQHGPILIEASSTPNPFPWGCNTDSVAPPAATSFVTTGVFANRVLLGWAHAGAPDMDAFEIHRRRSTDAVGTEKPVVIGIRGTAYTDVTVKSGVSYVYTIYAYDKSRNKSAGVTVNVTTP